jgi:hypothetical protein
MSELCQYVYARSASECTDSKSAYAVRAPDAFSLVDVCLAVHAATDLSLPKTPEAAILATIHPESGERRLTSLPSQPSAFRQVTIIKTEVRGKRPGMSKFRPMLVSIIAAVVSSCGTYVPDIQDNPFATERERSDFIQAIARNVRCELQDSVIKLYAKNAPIDPYNRNLQWFDSWAAQMNLTLTNDNKGSFGPNLNWLQTIPNGIFNLGLGATLSSEAQRVDKIGSFFLILDLKRLQACHPEDRNRGPYILESNLKLYDWLEATMISINNADTPAPGSATGPLKSNVLSHEIKFDIVSSGNITPGVKQTRYTLNQSGNLLSGTLDRTQDLTFTFGPPDPNWAELVINPTTNAPVINPRTGQPLTRPTQLAPAAASVVLASEIANAITNGLRNGLR